MCPEYRTRARSWPSCKSTKKREDKHSGTLNWRKSQHPPLTRALTRHAASMPAILAVTDGTVRRVKASRTMVPSVSADGVDFAS